MAKNGQVHEVGEVGRSSATPTKLFSVDYYNLKSMSFKFCNDVFITFEMLRSTFLMIFWNQRSLGRLRHTQLNVFEKEELPCFLYLIQISAWCADQTIPISFLVR